MSAWCAPLSITFIGDNMKTFILVYALFGHAEMVTVEYSSGNAKDCFAYAKFFSATAKSARMPFAAQCLIRKGA